MNQVGEGVMSKPLLKIEDLVVHFYTEDGIVQAIDSVNLRIDRGDTLGLVGETGCGKSVTALSVLRLIPEPGKIIRGKIFFEGKDLLEISESEMREIRGSKISMIFQDPMTSLNPVFTVGRQIAEVFEAHQHMAKSDAEEKAVEMMKVVGIPESEKRFKDYPHQFSGGMRQRVMVAIALACRPTLLIADEPTTALDVTIQAQILDEMNKLKKNFGTNIMMITHDLAVISQVSDKVAVMYAGNVVEYSDVRTVIRKPWHPYTRGLLNALPSAKGRERLISIRGTVPNLLHPPSGCRFHPRCTKAMRICSRQKPHPIEVEPDHFVSCHLYT